MLDSLKAFFMLRTYIDDCTYQVSSPYKVFNLLAVGNMSEKTPQDLWGLYTPFGGQRKPPFIHLKNKKNLSMDAWDNFDNTGK